MKLTKVSPSRTDMNTIQKTIDGNHPTCVGLYLPDNDDDLNKFVDVTGQDDLPF